MIWREFSSQVELEDELLSFIEKQCNIVVKSDGTASVLLSGGSTPLELYSKFHQLNISDWSKIKLGLTDERWVDLKSNYSNYKAISNVLGEAFLSNCPLHSLVHTLEDEKKNIELAKKKNKLFFEEKSIVLLGMGDDGHTASIFPGNEYTELALSENYPNISLNRAPTHPEIRITHNLRSILQTKKLILYVKGEQKRRILDDAMDQLLPISYCMNSHASELEIYWTA
jgi:6-phosphogluconolactonase